MITIQTPQGAVRVDRQIPIADIIRALGGGMIRYRCPQSNFRCASMPAHRGRNNRPEVVK